MSGGQVRLTARVDGRVQGVGFRYFVQHQATRLGVVGWVRNERDGSVRVVAEGGRAHLDQLMDVLRRGPSAAIVRDVDASWDEASGEFQDFSTRHF